MIYSTTHNVTVAYSDFEKVCGIDIKKDAPFMTKSGLMARKLPVYRYGLHWDSLCVLIPIKHGGKTSSWQEVGLNSYKAVDDDGTLAHASCFGCITNTGWEVNQLNLQEGYSERFSNNFLLASKDRYMIIEDGHGIDHKVCIKANEAHDFGLYDCGIFGPKDEFTRDTETYCYSEVLNCDGPIRVKDPSGAVVKDIHCDNVHVYLGSETNSLITRSIVFRVETACPAEIKVMNDAVLRLHISGRIGGLIRMTEGEVIARKISLSETLRVLNILADTICDESVANISRDDLETIATYIDFIAPKAVKEYLDWQYSQSEADIDIGGVWESAIEEFNV